MIEEPPDLIMVLVSQKKDQQPSQRRSLSSLFPYYHQCIGRAATNYAPTPIMVKHNSPDFDAPPPNEGVIVKEAVPGLLSITVRPYIKKAAMRVPRIRREVSLHTHQWLVPLLLGWPDRNGRKEERTASAAWR